MLTRHYSTVGYVFYPGFVLKVSVKHLLEFGTKFVYSPKYSFNIVCREAHILVINMLHLLEDNDAAKNEKKSYCQLNPHPDFPTIYRVNLAGSH